MMDALICQDYRIEFGDVVLHLNKFLSEHDYSRVAILVDENTRASCLPIILEKLDCDKVTVIEIPAGEEFKTIASCESIWKRLLMAGFDRHSLLINLGGGVIGDMGGFCAATFMRGIDFIQVPTSLLAQVDASVGGKLAVDLEYVKNIVGLFCNPKLVLIDRVFLESLPQDHLRSGMAELVKHALIRDKKLWAEILHLFHSEATEKRASDFLGLKPQRISYNKLRRSIEIKRDIVALDPKEKDVRKLLNYGHTVGHAVETNSWNTDEPILHGDAVIIGMICENYIAFKKNFLSRELMDDVNESLRSIYFKRGACSDSKKIWEYMLKDKKNRRNKVYASLLQGIGSAVYDIEITHEEVMDSFSYYQKL